MSSIHTITAAVEQIPTLAKLGVIGALYVYSKPIAVCVAAVYATGKCIQTWQNLKPVEIDDDQFIKILGNVEKNAQKLSKFIDEVQATNSRFAENRAAKNEANPVATGEIDSTLQSIRGLIDKSTQLVTRIRSESNPRTEKNQKEATDLFMELEGIKPKLATVISQINKLIENPQDGNQQQDGE